MHRSFFEARGKRRATGLLACLSLALAACSSAGGGGGTSTCGAQSCQAGEYCLNQTCVLGCLTDSNCDSTQRCEKAPGSDVGSCQHPSDGGAEGGGMDASLTPDTGGATDANADAPATFPCGSKQCVYAQEACVEFPNSTSCVAIPISDQCNLSVCADAATHFAYLCSTSNYPNAVCTSGGDTCRLTIECVL